MRQKIGAIVSNINLQTMLKDYLLLTAGALLLAVNMNLFLIPANIAPGGVSGMALIVNRLVGWPVGTAMLVLNIPMLILGFHYLGRFNFLVRTLYVVLLFNLGIDLFSQWLPNGITNDLLLNTLYGAIVGGIGYGLIFWGRGTSAGTGVLSRIIQLKTGVPVSQIYMITDGFVITGLGLVFGWDKALYSLLNLFLWGVVTDYVLEGPSVIRTAFIVTDKAETVSQRLFNQMGIGVTSWAGRGMFTNADRTILFCTISRPDVNTLKRIVSEIDPQAFVVIGQGHQAKGGVLRQVKTHSKP